MYFYLVFILQKTKKSSKNKRNVGSIVQSIESRLQKKKGKPTLIKTIIEEEEDEIMGDERSHNKRKAMATEDEEVKPIDKKKKEKLISQTKSHVLPIVEDNEL